MLRALTDGSTMQEKCQSQKLEKDIETEYITKNK